MLVFCNYNGDLIEFSFVFTSFGRRWPFAYWRAGVAPVGTCAVRFRGWNCCNRFTTMREIA